MLCITPSPFLIYVYVWEELLYVATKNKYATTLKSVTKFNVANTRSNFQIELMLRQECVNNLDVSNGCKNHQFYTKQ